MCNIDAVDSLGVSALAAAKVRGDAAMARLLCEAGATIDEPELPAPATCAAVSFCSAGLPGALATQGQIFYEVVLVRVGPCPQIGWAAPGFTPGGGNGVGDDTLSWGADGARGKLWRDGSWPWDGGPQWRDGDVVGCAADLAEGKAWFAHNGAWSLCFEGCAEAWRQGVFPAISGQRMAFAINASPRFAGPTPAFRNAAAGLPELLDRDGKPTFVSQTKQLV